MDADRQVEKMWTEEQKKALAAKLRMHEEAGMTPVPEPKPQYFPPPPKKKVTSI
jgi:hypothetical protein